jgi:hypothetical protein
MSANYCSGSSKNCPAPAHDQAVLHNLCARETPGTVCPLAEGATLAERRAAERLKAYVSRI